jgi:hypothetical protein
MIVSRRSTPMSADDGRLDEWQTLTAIQPGVDAPMKPGLEVS